MRSLLDKPAFLTGTFTLLGVLLGSLTQVATSWVRRRNERNSTIRKSLFIALALWDILLRSRLEEFVEKYFVLIETNSPGALDDEQKGFLAELILQILSDFIDEENLNRINGLGESLNASLHDLAGLTPVLAYRLQGCQDIIRMTTRYRDWIFRLKARIQNDAGSLPSNVNAIFSDSSARVVKTSLTELEKFCISLSTRYDLLNLFSVFWTIHSQKKRFSKRLDEGLKRYIDTFTPPKQNTDENKPQMGMVRWGHK